jgi:hypothetical protein
LSGGGDDDTFYDTSGGGGAEVERASDASGGGGGGAEVERTPDGRFSKKVDGKQASEKDGGKQAIAVGRSECACGAQQATG